MNNFVNNLIKTRNYLDGNWKFFFILFLVLNLLFYLSYSYIHYNDDFERCINFKISNNWNCLDGCYEMMLLCKNVSRFEYDDESSFSLYNQCSLKCSNLTNYRECLDE
jgi:hypothetical protein